MKKKQYTKEFKREAVELAKKEGNSFEQVAEDLGINIKTLYKWSSELLRHGAGAFPGTGRRSLCSEQSELEDLKKELKRVTAEREILKKALQFFARE